MPDLPIRVLKEASDPADKNFALPDALSDLPESTDATVALDGSWTQVPGAPVSVRADADTTVAETPADPAGDVDGAAIRATADESSEHSETPSAPDAVEVSVDPGAKPQDAAALMTFSDASFSTDPDVTDPESPVDPTDPSTDPTSTPSSSPDPLDVPSLGASSPSASTSPSSSPDSLDSPTVAVQGLDVRVSYADFAQAFGGDWAERLEVLAYPGCYVTTPEIPACSQATPVASSNDSKSQTVSFTTLTTPSVDSDGGVGSVAGPASARGASRSAVPVAFETAATTTGGATTYAVTADPAGFGEISVPISSSWQVGVGSGDFSWQYPMGLTDVMGTGAPDLGLSYSSGSVDSMSMFKNGQAASVGAGWSDPMPGVITRTYKACSQDGMPNKGDLCWLTKGNLVQGLTMTLNGQSNMLVRQGSSNIYRLQDDPNWRVERVVNGDASNTDNDNEAFKVTTPDGAVYWFGYGHGSEAVSTVPVYGNDDGEPCKKSVAADSWCQQGWQWNLDKVIDPVGNVTRYSYNQQENYYSRYANTNNLTVYDRASTLADIKYGFDGEGAFHGQVLFTNKPRCAKAADDLTYECSVDADKPAQWPDTPRDLMCGAKETSCQQAGPSFFTTTRLAKVESNAIAQATPNGAATTRMVDTWTLHHSFADTDGSNGPNDPALWLKSIDRTGAAPGSSPNLARPTVKFGSVALANRVATPNNAPDFSYYRVGSVLNEAGGFISVDYGHANADQRCTGGNVPPNRWGTSRECFAQYITLPGAKDPTWVWFHKYVVNRVTLGDKALGYDVPADAPDPGLLMGQLRVYDYDYNGNAAWRFSAPANVATPHAGWSDWRGYRTTIVHTRKTDHGQLKAGDDSQQVYVRFRGMYNTAANDSGGRHTDPDDRIDPSDPDSRPDYPWFAGRTWREKTQTGGGDTLTMAQHEFHGVTTADDTFGNLAKVVLEDEENDSTASSHGPVHKTIVYGYNESAGVSLGNLTSVRTTGYDGSGGTQTTCTTTSWVNNDANWIHAPADIRTYGSNCANPTNLTARTVNHYDQDGPLTQGMLTATDTYTTNNSTFAPSTYNHDRFGRLTRTTVKDSTESNPVLSRVDTTYNTGGSDGDILTKVSTATTAVGVKAPMTTTTTLDPIRGLPSASTDINGHTVRATRDGLGRPLEVTQDNTSLRTTYAYDDNQLAASRVAVASLRAGASYNRSYAFTDGWGRTIQTQVPQVNDTNARVASVTGYDDQGLVAYDLPTVQNGGGFGTLANPDPTDVAVRYTRNTYDAMGRETRTDELSAGDVRATTTTRYDGNHETVRPPVGEAVDTTYDAWGQPGHVVQHPDGDRIVEAFYGYTPEGDLASIDTPDTDSDSAGGWRYSYDLAGQRVRSVDPDTGATSYAYDGQGNLVETKDATGATVRTVYDGLGRPTSRRDGSSVTHRWSYDNADVPNAIGRMTSRVDTIDLDGTPVDLETSVPGYDEVGQSLGTTWTYPSELTGEAPDEEDGETTSKTERYEYNLTGDRTKTTYPATAGLAELSVNTLYGPTSSPLTISTSAPGGGDTPTEKLVIGAYTYEHHNVVTDIESRSLESQTATCEETAADCFSYARTYGWDFGSERLTGIRATVGTGPSSESEPAFGLSYRYDAGGNPLRVTETTEAGSGAWCYDYDGLSRLSRAFTGSPGDEGGCGPLTDTAVVGDAYDVGYEYVGDRLSQVTAHEPGREPGAVSGSVDYVYDTQPEDGPGSADAGPSHGVGRLVEPGAADPALPSPASLTYDPAGRVTSLKPTRGNDSSYHYDEAGNLVRVESGGVTTVNGYRDDGVRVLERESRPGGGSVTTLFLGETELRATRTAGGSVSQSAVRHLSSAGGTALATQHDDGQWTWLTADAQGSIRSSWQVGAAKPTQTSYYPYGAPITGGGGQAGQSDPAGRSDLGGRGYLNRQHESNGDIRLDHRSYTPSLNVLTTPDPLLAPYDPANLNPYTYARHNPLSLSDPSGLMIPYGSGASTDAHPVSHVKYRPAYTGHNWPTSYSSSPPPTNPWAGTRIPGMVVRHPHFMSVPEAIQTGQNLLHAATHPVETAHDMLNTGLSDANGCAERVINSCGSLWLDLTIVGDLPYAIGRAGAMAAARTAAKRELSKTAAKAVDDVLPGVKAGWPSRVADNGKGKLWQAPGSTGNANMLRVMEPTERYPHGYVRFYNQHGQPIGLNGKPGSRADTHIPRSPDGNYDLPEGW